MNADRLREVYDAAAQLPPEERSAYLDRACAGDAPLRERVEALLRQSVQADTFFATAELQGPLAGVAPDARRDRYAAITPERRTRHSH